MMSKAIVALALLEEAAAFQAPAVKASTKALKAVMFEEGDIGALRPVSAAARATRLTVHCTGHWYWSW